MRALDPEVVEAVWAATAPKIPGTGKQAPDRRAPAAYTGQNRVYGVADQARHRLFLGHC